MHAIPVILDTDIGSDIDDALALAYLLKQPLCELVGITTVTGEPQRRAGLAAALCEAAGRKDIPIHPGAALPLVGVQRQPHAPQAEVLAAQEEPFQTENSAVKFLRDAIYARPGEITLLAIGPLTNIALLFALYPETPGMLSGLMMMGGRFLPTPEGGSAAEWNILCDPCAAARVFEVPALKRTAVGLDVTEKCRMGADLCRERFLEAGGPLGVAGSMAEVWFRNSKTITFHDPLAAALLFKPELCRYEQAGVKVGLMEGTTGAEFTPEGPDAIAVEAEPEAFFAHYFDIAGA